MENRSGGELGAFLRSRRARLTPQDVGLPDTGRHRRVPGLRREELAQLAGVSVAYLTRLEQGHGPNVSAEVLDALARALRLTENEHAHLRRLARNRRNPDGPPSSHQVREPLRQLLTAMDSVPAYVTGPFLDLLAWNPMATALFGDWERLEPGHRNLARLVFLSDDHRGLFTGWNSLAADTVGALRLDAGCFPDHPRLSELVGELSAESAEFRALWARHDVKERGHGTRRLRHPAAGELLLAFESFRLADDADQCLTTFHTPPDAPNPDALRLLTPRPATL
ncbi:helix-turn-helix domain-containing protein [Actinomadura oligospora]|uniref:helix-turn-helix domain-containing protein n=1 Tax=Actinomadura oligospora TaxID=111804 RepID=UPI0004B08607|nr:helix-turn-helix transcriptional regulator [Actinomadura oligospora]